MNRLALLLAALAASADAQVMDLSCMQVTRQKTDAILQAYKEEGRSGDDPVFNDVKAWSTRVEHEGHQAQARVDAAIKSAADDDATRQAARAVRDARLDSSSADETRRFQEARELWQAQRARAVADDARYQEAIRASIDKQGEWNRTEIELKERIYAAAPPAKSVAKHQEEAAGAFESKHGYVPAAAGEALGILAAMGEVAAKMQLGAHDVVLYTEGKQGFVDAIEPVRVLLRTADLSKLHGDMAVSHVHQVAPPVEVRRRAAAGEGPAVETMRSAARETAIGLQNLSVADSATAKVRDILAGIPPPPVKDSAPPPESAVTAWTKKVEAAIEKKGAEIKKDPIWTIIIRK